MENPNSPSLHEEVTRINWREPDDEQAADELRDGRDADLPERGLAVTSDVDGNEYMDFISSLGLITLDIAIRRWMPSARALRRTIFSMMHPLDGGRPRRHRVPCAEMVESENRRGGHAGCAHYRGYR
jgi:hypothetical protein